MSLLKTIALTLPIIFSRILPTPAPGESNLGHIILILFLSPVVALLSASILDKPRDEKLIAILIGTLSLFTFGFITLIYILSVVLGIFF